MKRKPKLTDELRQAYALKEEYERIEFMALEGKIEKNDFLGDSFSLDEFPAIKADIETKMPSGYALPRNKSYRFGSEPRLNTIDVQYWTHGVGYHTDDAFGYFGVYCIATFDNLPRVNYVHDCCLLGPRGRVVTEFEPGSFGIFDPQKKHALLHGGLDVVIGLVSVKKTKKNT